MRNPKLLVALVLVVPAAILATLWIGRAPETGEPGGAIALGPGSGQSQEASPEMPLSPVPGARARETADAAPLATGGGPRELAGSAAEDPQERGLDPDAARWIEARVEFEGDAPSDDTLTVLALAATEENGSDLSGLQRALATRRGWDLWREAVLREQDVAYARRPVVDGVARLPLPGDATRAVFLVDGRFAYLEAPFELELEAGAAPSEVRLEARLGACATFSWKLPAGASERGVSQLEPSGKVSLQMSGMFRRNRRTPPTSYEYDLEDWRGRSIEARAVPADELLVLRARIDGLALHEEIGLRLGPGEVRELEMDFELGGELSGRVLGNGEPLAGATVRTAGGLSMLGRSLGRAETKTQDDGSFRIVGVSTGQVVLEVEAAGWLDGKSEALEVLEGEAIAGVEIQLERGAHVAGRVTFGDGSAAAGARIEVRGKSGARRGPWQPERKLAEVAADGDGSFEVFGLPESDVVVIGRHGREPEREERRAPWMPSEEDAEALPEDEDGPGWFARAEGVTPGAGEVELVLSQLGAVVGSVRDEQGAPIDRFEIEARPSASSDNPWMNDQRLSETFEEATDGGFQLWGVHPGSWTLEVSAKGYAAISESEAQVEVVAGAAGEPVELVLARAATIRGRVVDPTGQGAAARVTASAGGQQRWWGQGGGSTRTDETGRFELEGLPVGALTVRAESEDWSWASSEEQTFELASSEQLDDVLLELRVGGRLTGEVYDSDGNPARGRRVTYSANAWGGGFGGSPSATTDDAGYFAFEHVTPGTWIVSAGPNEEELLNIMAKARDESAWMDMFSDRDSETVDVLDGGEVHVRLGGDPRIPVRVVGRVTRSGEVVENARVVAIAEGGSIMEGMKMASTTDGGSFEITVDRPGGYLFTVEPGGRANQSQFPIDVPEIDEYSIELALPTGALTGTVTEPDGAPAVATTVTLSREGESRGLRMGASQVETDSGGTYAFEGLEPGTYTVRCGGGSGFRVGGEVEYGTAILDGLVVEADATTRGADLALTAPATLEGKVRDEDGSAVAGASVFVRDELGRALTTVSGVVTDAAGRFVYEGVAPGVVTVSARTAELATRESDPVRVEEGATAEVDLTLEGGTTLVVEVVDGDGEPLRARVRVWNEADMEVGNLMTFEALSKLFSEGFSTRESRIGPLPPGKYRVEATDDEGRSSKKPVRLSGQDERRVKLRLRD